MLRNVLFVLSVVMIATTIIARLDTDGGVHPVLVFGSIAATFYIAFNISNFLVRPRR